MAKQKQVKPYENKDWGIKGQKWAAGVTPSLFSEDKHECLFTYEDLACAFAEGVKTLRSCVWHDVHDEKPDDGVWCLLETTCGFRLATYRLTQSGSYRWWLMDYSMYDGKGLIRWAYISDLLPIDLQKTSVI